MPTFSVLHEDSLTFGPAQRAGPPFLRTLGIEPRAFCIQSGRDATRPHARSAHGHASNTLRSHKKPPSSQAGCVGHRLLHEATEARQRNSGHRGSLVRVCAKTRLHCRRQTSSAIFAKLDLAGKPQRNMSSVIFAKLVLANKPQRNMSSAMFAKLVLGTTGVSWLCGSQSVLRIIASYHESRPLMFAEAVLQCIVGPKPP